jgi:co-chaperonin GroES (HSP10)
MLNITLTQDLLLIRPLPDEDPVTPWGFVLPATDEHAETPLRGLVLAAGPGRVPKLGRAGHRALAALQAMADEIDGDWSIIGMNPRRMSLLNTLNEARAALAAQATTPERQPMQVKVGDTVIYSKNLFQRFRIDGEDLAVTQEASILGIIDRAD